MSVKGLVLTVAGVGCLTAASVGGFMAMQVPARAPLTSAPVDLTSVAVEPSAAIPDSTSNPATTSSPAPATEVTVPRATANGAPARRAGNSGRNAPRPAAVATRPADPVATPAPTPVRTAPVEAPVASTATASGSPPAQTAEIALPPSTSPAFDEITIEDAAVIGIELESAVSSQTAKVEDKVTGRVSRDVTVGGKTAIPAGTRVEGHVTLVETGGKFKDRSRLGIRFTTIVLSDRTRVPMQTEAIFREGDAPGKEATLKVGAGTAIGAIIGGVVGGRRSAAIGAAAGAAGGTAAVMAGGRNHAVLAAGTPLTLRLTAPVTVLIERGGESR